MKVQGWTADAELVGESIPMQHLRAEIAVAAPSEIPVVISGETGTGKELVALELHRRSARRGSFVPVNVCATSDAMFEASMFGHSRGAFTGAVDDRRGFFSEADGGTLFLDEICSLSMDAQAKLLRAIDTHRFRPVGGRSDRLSSFRLVTATNRSLSDEVASGRFRADLYYRLLGFEITVPPLRERPDDVPVLFSHFLDVVDPDRASPRQLSCEASDWIVRHDWPGNVRELRHVTWRVATRAAGAQRIEIAHFASHRITPADALGAAFLSPKGPLDPERQLLVDALMRHSWDAQAVAQELGVTRKTIYARMKRLRLPTRRQRIADDGMSALGLRTDAPNSLPHH